ncbi:MAG: peptide deformylase [Odoribacteraceae bacterium]|jgi:peptide deformylase|nr:peptide deformylase [Odoribacteraceae bacterium]
MKKTGYWFVLLAGVIASCSPVSSFSARERALVRGGVAEDPFRVLQVTNRADSLLLRVPCTDVQNFADPLLARCIERLRKTLIVEDGVGIAAPQVGISKNIFLFMRVDLPGTPVVAAINPRIVNHPDTTVCFERDGCLSIPGVQGNSTRYPWIEVEYRDERGEVIRERLEGYSRRGNFTAVIFQHEFDHTRGVLFIDKLCDLPKEF